MKEAVEKVFNYFFIAWTYILIIISLFITFYVIYKKSVPSGDIIAISIIILFLFMFFIPIIAILINKKYNTFLLSYKILAVYTFLLVPLGISNQLNSEVSYIITTFLMMYLCSWFYISLYKFIKEYQKLKIAYFIIITIGFIILGYFLFMQINPILTQRTIEGF